MVLFLPFFFQNHVIFVGQDFFLKKKSLSFRRVVVLAVKTLGKIAKPAFLDPFPPESSSWILATSATHGQVEA